MNTSRQPPSLHSAPRIAPARGHSRAYPLLAGGLVFMGAAQALALGVSVAGANLNPLRSLLVLGVAAVAGVVTSARVRRPEASDSSDAGTALAGWVTAALALALYGGLWWVAWQKPDLTWDGNATHIPVVHFWALAGRVHWIVPEPSDWSAHIYGAWNSTPKAANVFAFLFVQATQAHRLLNAYNLPWLPLGFLGVYVLARSLSARRGTALTAAALFVLAPVMVNQGPTAYVDAATASVFAALLGMLALVLPELAAKRLQWRDAPALAAAVGLTLGVKITGAVFAAATCVAVAGFVAWACRGRGGLGRWMRAGAWLAVVAVGAAAVGGYWYVRNYARNGNPVYPVEVALAGRTIFPGQTTEAMLRPGTGEAAGTVPWPQTSRVVFSWLQGGDRWPVSLRAPDSREGGLGFAWLLAGLPAVTGLLIASAARTAIPPERRPMRGVPLLTVYLPLFAVVAVTFLMRPWNHWPRHTVWLLALGLPCWAVLLDRLGGARAPAARRFGQVWLVAVVAIALFEATYTFAWTATRSYVRHPNWPRFDRDVTTAARSLTWYDPAGYMRPELAGGPFEEVFASRDPVAFGAFHAQQLLLMGRLCQPMGARPVHFIDWQTAEDPEALRAYVAARGLRYLVWSGVHPYPPALDTVAVRRTQSSRWFHLFEFAPAGRAGAEARP